MAHCFGVMRNIVKPHASEKQTGPLPKFQVPESLPQDVAIGAIAGLLIGATGAIGLSILRENNQARFPLKVEWVFAHQDACKTFEQLLKFRAINIPAYDACIGTFDQMLECAMLCEKNENSRLPLENTYPYTIRRLGHEAGTYLYRLVESVQRLPPDVLSIKYELSPTQTQQRLPELRDELLQIIADTTSNATLSLNRSLTISKEERVLK